MPRPPAKADGFTDRSFPPIGIAADLHILHSPPRETHNLSAPRPCIPSHPGQRAEARETSPAESSGVPLRPILPPHLHPSPGLATCWADYVDACCRSPPETAHLRNPVCEPIFHTPSQMQGGIEDVLWPVYLPSRIRRPRLSVR